MKVLIETTGKFGLVDPTSRNSVIKANRPSVHEKTSFVHQRAILGQLRHLGDLSDAATDAEFKEYLVSSDGNVQLAIEAFLATYAYVAPETETATADREAVEREANERSAREEEARVQAAAAAAQAGEREAAQKAEREAAEKAAEAEANKGRKQK